MAGAQLREDPQSFSKPMEKADRDLTRELAAASRKVRGAEARVQLVLDQSKQLHAFVDAVAEHVENATFHALPEVVHNAERIEGLHALTIGPWEGVFLVNEDGSAVVALVFSRAPHDYADRLGELKIRSPSS